MLSHLHIVHGCFGITTAELSNCDKDLMAQSLKHLPSGPLQKMFADVCDTEIRRKLENGMHGEHYLLYFHTCLTPY